MSLGNCRLVFAPAVLATWLFWKIAVIDVELGTALTTMFSARPAVSTTMTEPIATLVVFVTVTVCGDAFAVTAGVMLSEMSLVAKPAAWNCVVRSFVSVTVLPGGAASTTPRSCTPPPKA